MANAGQFSEEETTRGGTPSKVSRTVPPLSEDLHEAMGQLMTEVVRQGRRVDEFGTRLDDALRSASDERPELVRRTAGHTSNRMAALLGALFVLYTEAAPVLHELWRGLHR